MLPCAREAPPQWPGGEVVRKAHCVQPVCNPLCLNCCSMQRLHVHGKVIPSACYAWQECLPCCLTNQQERGLSLASQLPVP